MILTSKCLKQYRQQYLPVEVTVCGDDTCTSNNRIHAHGGSRFYGHFLLLGDLGLLASTKHASLLKLS